MLTIYAPYNNQKSKAWEVFNGVQKTWPEQVVLANNEQATDALPNAMFWGFVNNNLDLVKTLELRKHQYWFTDTPYFGRFDNNNLQPNNHYWRICKNSIHAKFMTDCKADRFEKFNIKIKAPTMKGEHILVCPSSPTMNRYYGCPNWTNDVVAELKKHTDRPIRVRQKPRRNGTSGPAAALVSLKQDLENCHAIVTSVSMAAIEAAINGVPVFTNEFSPCAPIGLQELSKIEDPIRPSREDWAYSWAYAQFTPKEIESGLAYEILNDSAST